MGNFFKVSFGTREWFLVQNNAIFEAAALTKFFLSKGRCNFGVESINIKIVFKLIAAHPGMTMPVIQKIHMYHPEPFSLKNVLRTQNFQPIVCFVRTKFPEPDSQTESDCFLFFPHASLFINQ